MKARAAILAVLGLLTLSVAVAVAADAPAKDGNWSMNTTIIEACSCPMFCQCYFDTKPAGHSGHEGMAGHEGAAVEHFCKFNNAYNVNKGTYNGTNLAGAKFWISGDLGGDFSKGQTDWAVMTFDPSVTPAQREGIQAIIGHVYPVTWKSFKVGADAPMVWEHKPGSGMAHATLDGGKTAEVILKNTVATSEAGPAVIKNLRYFGASKNDGFVLMPNEVEAYRIGDKPFEFKGTNGFMITFDISSKDVAAQHTN